MVSSGLGYYYGSSDETQSYEYNSYTFKKVDSSWMTYIGETPYQLNYDPKSLESIKISGNLNKNELNSAQKIYLSYNPEEMPTQSIIALQTRISSLLRSNIFFILACTKDIPVCKDAVLKTCKDATSTEKVIELARANETALDYNNNCLAIQTESKDLIKATDRITWTLLGVMQ